jgi:membrane-associated phospholipid phosphatase
VLGLLLSRRKLEGVALLCGLALTVVAVESIGGVTERPPPPGSTTDAEPGSYPSEHGAYAAAWIAVAVALRHGLPGLSHRAAVLAIAILLATGIALARIYLHAEWFSDVAGGLALGALSFALTGIVALVVAHVRRQNTDDTGPAP